MKFKKNDEVVIIAGSHKNKVGKIEKIDNKRNLVWIKDINKVTKHIKPQQGQDGQIKQIEAPIHASNISILVKKATKNSPAVFSKIGYEIKGDKKVRISRRTKKEL
ncbi:LSU ribosomal protein L24p (L26e) [Mycoplasmopsis meleagridis]|uniref:Large ribosomal subunit protein uL24 n=1 Tax=Mycoplasmopsis meleagridis ATCC 25294 TaxID=1264554 RepID=A0A0F5H174_9BACT|nr:50S ribosomal protein L24 [Mycoplasmopsis meleagridis]KKB27056.1 LSU ribosomal protein L24p (L26e) [Mycoplasmopsis meleagridis ATCC 25294]KUH47232.1 50S ribosomal protein L24 [Mycoplasmopsis meleagridis]OAD18449.1 LSU ribosomal protein L24p (L26e) [Mycoplasmopsis meleagridis]VEU77361.1 50S ribosomal protein L24 [Mycoplasmopsis meleagridis]